MTEKRQTSQGYIIRILQHFATTLRNITNFVMLFQAVMKFLSRLVEIKILAIRGQVNCETSDCFTSRHRGGCFTSRDTKIFFDSCLKNLFVM